MASQRQEKRDRLIRAEEVAEMTGLSVATIYHGEAGTDELLRIPLGRAVRFSYLDVVGWIERKKREAREKQRAKPKPVRLTLIKTPALGKRTIDRICSRKEK